MVTFAKGITSGYFPLGGIGVSDAIAAALDAASGDKTWMHAFTYSAHPVGCAVALANLDILEREKLLPRAAELGRRLMARLQNARVASARRRGARAGADGGRRTGGRQADAGRISGRRADRPPRPRRHATAWHVHPPARRHLQLRPLLRRDGSANRPDGRISSANRSRRCSVRSRHIPCAVRGCERMGTGTSRTPLMPGFSPSSSEPVPILSQALRTAAEARFQLGAFHFFGGRARYLTATNPRGAVLLHSGRGRSRTTMRISAVRRFAVCLAHRA